MAIYDDLENARSWLKTGYRKQPLSQQAAPGAGYTPPVSNTPDRTAVPAAAYSGPGATPTPQKRVVWDERFPLPDGSVMTPGGIQRPKTPGPTDTRLPRVPDAPPAPTTKMPTTPAGGLDPSKVTPSTFQGFAPKYAMEGFDFAREQNTGKSAKDAFAFLSNNAPPPPINNKAALGQWFQQYIAPGMNALGHKIVSVDGDKFRFSNWQGTFDVDFGRGAGAEGGALAWQVDDGTAQMSNGAYTPQAVIDPQTGVVLSDPRSTEPTSNTMPISSAITYRRAYQPSVNDASPWK